jgi:hypothetical protein
VTNPLKDDPKRASPAPNTFVGSNGVRTVDSSGQIQRPSQAAAFSGVTAPARPAPTPRPTQAAGSPMARPQPALPRPDAGPPAELAGVASSASNPAPNTFVGSAGVRTIDRVTGAPQQTLSGRGNFSGGRSAAAPAGGATATLQRPVPSSSVVPAGPPRNSPVSLQRPMVTADTGAIDRSARTATRAAQRMLDPRTAENELLRRFQHSQGGKATATARAAAAKLFLGALEAGPAAAREALKGTVDATTQATESNARLASTGMQEEGNTSRTRMQEQGDTFRTSQTLDASAKEGAANRQALLQRPSNPITLEDGRLGTITGNTFQTVTGADGSPVRMPTRPSVDQNALARLAPALGEQYLGADQYGTVPGEDDTRRPPTAEEREAALARGAEMARAMLSGQTAATPSPAVGGVPDGYKLAGHKDGKPVYASPDGKHFIGE